jgi:peptidoglycan/xylan/chitin deacetylase (PgdA/CDA1 family)
MPWPDGTVCTVVLSFDVDGESGVLWDFPESARRLGIMSHQAYGPRAGLPRLLEVLARHDARATFFVPGFTAETYPDAVRAIVDAGHEVGHHGYVHEVVTELSAAAEAAVLERGCEILETLTGARPRGWRAPMWEMNYSTPALLAAHGFAYDSSLMDADLPYLLGTGPEPGAPALVELPLHWSQDDGEQYAWLPGIWETGVIESPEKLLRMWELDFEATLAEGGCLVLTMHPFLSGRPARAAAFERLLTRIAETPGVWLATAGEVAAHVEGLGLEPVYHEPPQIAQADLARRPAPAPADEAPKEET